MNYISHDPFLIIALSGSSSLIIALSHFPIIIDFPCVYNPVCFSVFYAVLVFGVTLLHVYVKFLVPACLFLVLDCLDY